MFLRQPEQAAPQGYASPTYRTVLRKENYRVAAVFYAAHLKESGRLPDGSTIPRLRRRLRKQRSQKNLGRSRCCDRQGRAGQVRRGQDRYPSRGSAAVSGDQAAV